MEGRPVDRAAMIEAASRNLRQQMGRARDHPRSRGNSFYDAQNTAPVAATGSDARVSREPKADSAENAARRIRSAENEHRIVHAQQSGAQRESGPMPSSSQPPSALDYYPADADPSLQPLVDGEAPDFEDLVRRPLSRKKDPAASAAAGLGASASPTKMMDAFEQRKARQPIPVESWGPRPPSRQGGLPAKTSGLDGSFEEPRSSPGYPPSSSSHGRGSKPVTPSAVGGTWAAARHAPMHETRTPNRKARGSPEDLGIYGSSAQQYAAATSSTGRSPTNQQLAKALGGVMGGGFSHNSPAGRPIVARPDTRESTGRPDSSARPDTSSHPVRPDAFVAPPFGQDGGSWASHVDTEPAPLDTGNMSFGDAPGPWPSSPAGSSCGSPPTRQGARGQASQARHSSENVQVEDVDNDVDLVNARRRDATPPRLVITRSSQQKKERGSSRGNVEGARRAPGRGRDQRERDRGGNVPFSTGLDPDFLGLFAS